MAMSCDAGGKHMFGWDWSLGGAVFAGDRGKVFSCFACGGGSTMGYKLAGFDVIGCDEIDGRMVEVYERNHHPRLVFNEDIRSFKVRGDLPGELFDLDILDGSPPCSTFSVAGLREKAWGVERRFREGQAAQVLDTLFFDFIDLAARLRPKVVVAENVKGIVMGNAKRYVSRIYAGFDEAGYTCQHFLLDASRMGVPQRRERVFFLCLRKDLAAKLGRWSSFTQPYIDMAFGEEPIPFSEIALYDGRTPSPLVMSAWERRKAGDRSLEDTFAREEGKRKMWNNVYVYGDRPVPTLTTSDSHFVCFDRPVYMSPREAARASTFPSDYDFCGCRPYYVCGMSVPPVMMAQVASRVYGCWLSAIAG